MFYEVFGGGIRRRPEIGAQCATELTEHWAQGYGKADEPASLFAKKGETNPNPLVWNAAIELVEDGFEGGDRFVARGLVNYGAADTARILRQPSSQIEAILGWVDEPELIHRDNLVLLG